MDSSVPRPAALLLDFIGKTEAPRGYDTVYGNNQRKLPKKLTAMTVNEIHAAQPGWTKNFGSSACGRYQFMRDTLDKPGTLEDLRGELGLTGDELFTPDLQDRLAFHLLKRRGYERFMAGRIGVAAFGKSLAQEWASFPVLAGTRGQKRKVTRGQSFYEGDGLNKSLITPEQVEAVLGQMRPDMPAERAPKPAPAAAAAAPVPATVEPSGGRPGLLTALWRRLRGRPAVPNVPVVAGSRGDPTIFAVQSALKQRAYYTRGMPDGIDGPLTRDAVAAVRKDNGMGDGGIDAAFLQRLPTFPQRPVTQDRAAVTVKEAAAHVPELFQPSAWLWKTGLGLVLGGSAEGAKQTGWLDNVQGAAAQANDVFGQVQTAMGYVTGAVAFVVEHRVLIMIALGLVLVIKGCSFILDGWIKVRQAFF